MLEGASLDEEINLIPLLYMVIPIIIGIIIGFICRKFTKIYLFNSIIISIVISIIYIIAVGIIFKGENPQGLIIILTFWDFLFMGISSVLYCMVKDFYAHFKVNKNLEK